MDEREDALSLYVRPSLDGYDAYKKELEEDGDDDIICEFEERAYDVLRDAESEVLQIALSKL